MNPLQPFLDHQERLLMGERHGESPGRARESVDYAGEIGVPASPTPPLEPDTTQCDWCGNPVDMKTAIPVKWILHGWLEVERHYCNEKCFREREGC